MHDIHLIWSLGPNLYLPKLIQQKVYTLLYLKVGVIYYFSLS